MASILISRYNLHGSEMQVSNDRRDKVGRFGNISGVYSATASKRVAGNADDLTILGHQGARAQLERR
jgi:hypothetical protein